MCQHTKIVVSSVGCIYLQSSTVLPFQKYINVPPARADALQVEICTSMQLKSWNRGEQKLAAASWVKQHYWRNSKSRANGSLAGRPGSVGVGFLDFLKFRQSRRIPAWGSVWKECRQNSARLYSKFSKNSAWGQQDSSKYWKISIKKLAKCSAIRKFWD